MMAAPLASAQDDRSATTPAPAGVDLASEIQALQRLDLHELRVRWRKLLRTRAPQTLSRTLLFRILVYKLQARVHGDLDRETARYLERVARDYARRRAAGQGKPKAPPPVPRVPSGRGLKPGTLLAREFAGRIERVT